MHVLHREVYRDHEIVITQDEFAESPAEFDDKPDGVLWCVPPGKYQYALGGPDYADDPPDEDEEGWQRLPLYVYDHSGLSLGAGRICRWDSSQVGAVYYREGCEAAARALIRRWDAYLRGEVYCSEVAPMPELAANPTRPQLEFDPMGAWVAASREEDGDDFGGALVAARAEIDAQLALPSPWEQRVRAWNRACGEVWL